MISHALLCVDDKGHQIKPTTIHRQDFLNLKNVWAALKSVLHNWAYFPKTCSVFICIIFHPNTYVTRVDLNSETQPRPKDWGLHPLNWRPNSNPHSRSLPHNTSTQRVQHRTKGSVWEDVRKRSLVVLLPLGLHPFTSNVQCKRVLLVYIVLCCTAFSCTQRLTFLDIQRRQKLSR